MLQKRRKKTIQRRCSSRCPKWNGTCRNIYGNTLIKLMENWRKLLTKLLPKWINMWLDKFLINFNLMMKTKTKRSKVRMYLLPKWTTSLWEMEMMMIWWGDWMNKSRPGEIYLKMRIFLSFRRWKSHLKRKLSLHLKQRLRGMNLMFRQSQIIWYECHGNYDI